MHRNYLWADSHFQMYLQSLCQKVSYWLHFKSFDFSRFLKMTSLLKSKGSCHLFPYGHSWKP